MTAKLFFLMILAGFAGLLAVATVYKYFEVRIASNWPIPPVHYSTAASGAAALRI
jgi:hypothetical protein